MSVTPIPSDDEEDFDIYADLPCIKLDNNTPKKEGEKELENLRKQVSQITSELQAQQKNNEKLKSLNKNLSCNISILYRTASSEIQRKDRTITDLRRQLDDLCFRRKNRNPPKPTQLNEGLTPNVDVQVLRANLKYQLEEKSKGSSWGPNAAEANYENHTNDSTKKYPHKKPPTTDEKKEQSLIKAEPQTKDSISACSEGTKPLELTLVQPICKRSVSDHLANSKEGTCSDSYDLLKQHDSLAGRENTRMTQPNKKHDCKIKNKFRKQRNGSIEENIEVNLEISTPPPESNHNAGGLQTHSAEENMGPKQENITSSDEIQKNVEMSKNNPAVRNSQRTQETQKASMETKKNSKNTNGELVKKAAKVKQRNVDKLRNILPHTNPEVKLASSSLSTTPVQSLEAPLDTTTEEIFLSKLGETTSSHKEMRDVETFSNNAAEAVPPTVKERLRPCPETLPEISGREESPKNDTSESQFPSTSLAAEFNVSAIHNQPEVDQEPQEMKKDHGALLSASLKHLKSVEGSEYISTPTLISMLSPKNIQRNLTGSSPEIDRPTKDLAQEPLLPPLPEQDPAPLPPLPKSTPPPTPGKISPPLLGVEGLGNNILIIDGTQKGESREDDHASKTSCYLLRGPDEKKGSSLGSTPPMNSKLSNGSEDSNENLLLQCPFKPRRRAKSIVVLEDAPNVEREDSIQTKTSKTFYSAFTSCKSPDSKYKRTPLKKFEVHDNRLSSEYRHFQAQRSMYSSRHLSSVKSLTHMPERRSPSELLNGRSGRIVRLSHQDKIRVRMRDRRSRSLSPDWKRIKEGSRTRNSSSAAMKDFRQKHSVNDNDRKTDRKDERTKSKALNLRTNKKCVNETEELKGKPTSCLAEELKGKPTSHLADLFGEPSPEPEEKVKSNKRPSHTLNLFPSQPRDDNFLQKPQLSQHSQKSHTALKETLGVSGTNLITALKNTSVDDLEEDIIVVKRRPRSSIHLDNSENCSSKSISLIEKDSSTPIDYKKRNSAIYLEGKDMTARLTDKALNLKDEASVEKRSLNLRKRKCISKRGNTKGHSSDDFDESSPKADSDDSFDPKPKKARKYVPKTKSPKGKK